MKLLDNLNRLELKEIIEKSFRLRVVYVVHIKFDDYLKENSKSSEEYHTFLDVEEIYEFLLNLNFVGDRMRVALSRHVDRLKKESFHIDDHGYSVWNYCSSEMSCKLRITQTEVNRPFMPIPD